MRAILSDIHGNLEALRAVLADCERQCVREIYCLGDLVGYGPDPRECLDRAMKWKMTLRGNFEQALITGFEGFGEVAERYMRWTLAQLDYGWGTQSYLNFIARLPRFHREGDFLFVHGSPRDPLNEYISPADVYNPQKINRHFELIGRYCFQGHTHIPGVFTEDLRFHDLEELGGAYRLSEGKAMVNVGSVGQPRDGDWRACYALLDGNDVHFRQVEYDVDATVRKIYATPEIDRISGDRLREGR